MPRTQPNRLPDLTRFQLLILRGMTFSDRALGLTLMTVAGICLLVGFFRSMAGLASAAELTVLGEYSVPVGERTLSLADGVTLAIAAAVPGVWMWYAQPFGLLEAYLRGLGLLVTVGVVLALFDAVMPDDDIVRPE